MEVQFVDEEHRNPIHNNTYGLNDSEVGHLCNSSAKFSTFNLHPFFSSLGSYYYYFLASLIFIQNYFNLNNYKPTLSHF